MKIQPSRLDQLSNGAITEKGRGKLKKKIRRILI